MNNHIFSDMRKRQAMQDMMRSEPKPDAFEYREFESRVDADGNRQIFCPLCKARNMEAHFSLTDECHPAAFFTCSCNSSFWRRYPSTENLIFRDKEEE